MEDAKFLATGAKVTFVANFLGRKLRYSYEIVALIPGQKLVMKTSEGPFSMQTTCTWTALGKDTTKMTLPINGFPGGFFIG